MEGLQRKLLLFDRPTYFLLLKERNCVFWHQNGITVFIFIVIVIFISTFCTSYWTYIKIRFVLKQCVICIFVIVSGKWCL